MTIPRDRRDALFLILSAYFRALEDGTAAGIFPDPRYAWRYYCEGQRGGPLTIDRMRAITAGADAYMDLDAQVGYVNKSSAGIAAGGGYAMGPGLARLPDAALEAMFQEIDAMMAAPAAPAPVPDFVEYDA